MGHLGTAHRIRSAEDRTRDIVSGAMRITFLLFVVIVFSTSVLGQAQVSKTSLRILHSEADAKVVEAMTSALLKELAALKNVAVVKSDNTIEILVDMMPIPDPKPTRHAVSVQIFRRADCGPTKKSFWRFAASNISVVQDTELTEFAVYVAARLTKVIGG